MPATTVAPHPSNASGGLKAFFQYPFIKRPGPFLRTFFTFTLYTQPYREHPLGAVAGKLVRFMAYPKQFWLRRTQSLPVVGPFRIPPKKGYAALDVRQLPGFERVKTIGLHLFEERLPHFHHIAEATATGKDFMADMSFDEDLQAYPELVDFFLSDALLGMATDYLHTVPVLRRLSVLYSNHQEGYDDHVRSQLFHVDGEDPKQVKLFVHLKDVDSEDDGPFTFIPADATRRFFKRFKAAHGQLKASHRYTDEEVERYGLPKSQWVRGFGKVGQGLAVDTSRCLHHGSRVAPGHGRLILYVQYASYHNLAECKINVMDASRYPVNSPRYLALTPRVNPGMAGHFSNPL